MVHTDGSRVERVTVQADAQARADLAHAISALGGRFRGDGKSEAVRMALRVWGAANGAPLLQSVIAGTGALPVATDGDWLKALLSRTGVSQGAFAKRCGYERHDMISQMIAGRRPITDVVREQAALLAAEAGAK